MKRSSCRIGFISTRLAGTDGVSLEVVKWVDVLENLDHQCFFFAGESDWPPERSYIVPEAHFAHPDIQQISKDLFDDYIRLAETSAQVDVLKQHLKTHLYQFVQQFQLQLLIIENALAIPMNVPLGLALTELVAESNIPAIAHHHDFAWERSRFSVGAADDYLRAAFPPTLKAISHIVINSSAQNQLALRTGAPSMIVPNIMDFDTPPPEPDGYADDLRARLQILEEDVIVLQPTRIVPRKRIERAIELVKRLDMPATLIISHASGDEGSDYAAFLAEYIKLLGINVHFAEDLFAPERGQTAGGDKIYSLDDAYFVSDLVTYPSTIEGFGNAFLEAIYFCRPIVMSAYDIYRLDIKPKGFRVIEFDDYLTEETIRRTKELLQTPDLVEEMVDHNYEIAAQHYSYANLEKLLIAILTMKLGD